MTKKTISLILALLIALSSVFVLASCSDNGGSTGDQGTNQGGNDNVGGDQQGGGDDEEDDPAGSDDAESTGRYTNFDQETDYGKDDTKIEFTDSKVTVSGDGASVSGTVVTINKAGTYILSGSCTDGQVIVEVAIEEKVHLVFNGIKLICKESAPVYVKSCDKTTITLVEGTTSTLQDGSGYTDLNVDGEPNACLFSKDDLSINGTGTLNVYANYNNGICTKDDLKIISGTINVTAKNHGLRGNDSVTIKDGTFNISCKNDAIKSSKDTKEDKGYVYIDGGNFTIDAGDDALQAPLNVTVVGGKFSIDAGGDVVNCDGTVSVADGLFEY